MRTMPTVSYVEENGVVGCLLTFLMLRYHRLLSCERVDNVASTLSTKVAVNYSWADAVKGFNSVKW